MLTATCSCCGHKATPAEFAESSDCASCGASLEDFGPFVSAPASVLPKQKRPADHSAAHERLLRAAMLALSQFPEVDCLKLTQWSGETTRGTRIRAGMVRGAFDLLVLVCGRAVWLDAKTGSATLSEEQLVFQARMRDVGAVAEPFYYVEQAVEIVRRVISEIDPAVVTRVRANRARVRARRTASL